jgi:hypothetical protein
VRTPEGELLLCLARPVLPPAVRDRAAGLIRAGLLWDRVREAAESHGLTLLLHRHLASSFPALCPPGLVEALSARAHEIVGVNLALAAELAVLVPRLEGAGCRPVVVKGPALAVDVYGDLSSRPFGDLDIVVDRADARRAWDLLVAPPHGYVTPLPIAPPRRETVLRSWHEQAFLRQGSPLHVDLHWELSLPGYGDFMALDEVRPRLVKVRPGRVEVETLGPEDNLLFLCCHGLRHDWERLIWLADVAELVCARPRLDWDRVARWSRPPGRRRPVQLGLHLAHRLLDAPVPRAVLAEGDRDGAVARLADVVTAAFFAPAAAVSGSGPWSQVFRSVQFQGLARASDRLRHVARVFRPCALDWEVVPLPAWAEPAYYGVRVVRLLRKHGATGLGLSRRAGRD